MELAPEEESTAKPDLEELFDSFWTAGV